MGSRRSRVGRGLLAGVVVLAGVLGTATGARADEVYPTTSDGMLHLHGHGWGHGHGMSQYGALGAALAGKSWRDILSFYYQNTAQSSIGNPTLRINVPTVAAAGLIQVRNSSTLRLSWTGNDGTWASVGSDPRYKASAWRIRPTGSGTSIVEYWSTVTNSWTVYGAPWAGYAVFDDPTVGTVTAMLSNGSTVAYRGQLRGAMNGTSIIPVAAMPMEDYLKSVVPSESPSSWPLAALGAQSVAARSYAEYYRENPRAPQYYDICDSTACQVFSGTSVNGSPREFTSSNQAIAATAGTVLTYAGSVVFAEFSSSNGGWTSNGGKPYLLARQDPYDGTPSNPNHSWDASIPVSSIQATWPQIGTYLDLRITQRDGNGDWGGRVLQAVVEGTAGSVTVSGTSFQYRFGLKSEWFVPFNPPSAPSFPRDLTGDGNADVLGVDAASGRLKLYPGNGAGGWKPTVTMGPGWDTMAKVFTAGAWDGDGISDVMAQGQDGTLYLYPGSAGGGLQARRVVGTGWQMHNLVFAAGDFNGDGWSDLLARRASDGALFLYAGNGQGAFLYRTQIGTGWGGFTSIFSPGDFDGDGRRDVLARTADGTLWLYPGDGSGGWGTPRVVGTGWDAFTALTSPGDFNGDGNADVLARTADGTLWLYPGDGRGGWLPRVAVGSGWNGISAVLP